MNKELLKQIMSEPIYDSEDKLSSILSFRLMKQNVNNIKLLFNEETNDYYYSVKVDDVIVSDISDETLLELHLKGGWNLDGKSGKYLVRYLNY